MHLTYFKSDITNTPFEQLSNNTCLICGNNEFPQLLLDGSINIVAHDYEHGATVCLQCLFKEKYAFEHAVEGGYLTKNGIVTESEKYPYIKESCDYREVLWPKEERLLMIDASKTKELMHTPPFRAWQGAILVDTL